MFVSSAAEVADKGSVFELFGRFPVVLAKRPSRTFKQIKRQKHDRNTNSRQKKDRTRYDHRNDPFFLFRCFHLTITPVELV